MGYTPPVLPANKLYIGGLPSNVTTTHIVSILEKYGLLKDFSMFDNQTGLSKGCGFAEYADERDAADACAQLNGSVMDGNQISVRVYHAPALSLTKLRSYLNFTQLSEGSWELTEELCQLCNLNYTQCSDYMLVLFEEVDHYLKLKILATYLIMVVMNSIHGKQLADPAMITKAQIFLTSDAQIRNIYKVIVECASISPYNTFSSSVNSMLEV